MVSRKSGRTSQTPQNTLSAHRGQGTQDHKWVICTLLVIQNITSHLFWYPLLCLTLCLREKILLFPRSRRGGYLRLDLILGLMPAFTPSLTNRMFHNPEHEISQKMRAVLGLCSSVLLFCETITWVTPVLTFFMESDTVHGDSCLGKSETLLSISPLPNQLTALNPSPSAGRIWKLGAEKSKGEGALLCGLCNVDFSPQIAPESHKCSGESF